MKVYNILEWIEDEEVGEVGVESLLSGFSCPKNKEVEFFLKNRAIDFAKRKTAITYFVMDDDWSLSAFFTLAHKNYSIPGILLKSSVKRKLEQYAALGDDGFFSVSAFLIAQVAKNFSGDPSRIAGDDLLDFAQELIRKVQRKVGGRVVIVECDSSIEKLIAFYERCGFQQYDKRKAEDGTDYCLFIKLI